MTDKKKVIAHSKSMVLKNKKRFGHFFFNSLDELQGDQPVNREKSFVYDC
jgi:hypothetical protein